MSDSGPLSITLGTSNITTAIPQIADNTWAPLKLNTISQKTIKDKGDVLEFEFQLTEAASSSEGKPIAPNGLGSKVFHSVFLFGKDGPEAVAERAAQNVARIIDALLGTGDADNTKGKPARPQFTPQLVPDLIGKVAYCNIKHKTDPNYPGVEIKKFMFPGDVTR